ncbi:MAG: BadF/BadG/BcrA/BcrD ATPase family protein [Pyrinomonadaceae bacterium]
MRKVILAIDGGGSRTRCLAINRDGEILGAGAGGASNHLLVDKKIVKASLDKAVNESLERAKINRAKVVCVSAGLAGVDYDGTGADEMRDLFRELGFADTVINGDMVIAHAGALAGGAGVLALAGTGSCVLGIDVNGIRVKVGGWGPVFGDEGSAYRIGQTALRAAARDFDGRGEKTALLDAVLKEFGLDDFQKTIELVYLKGLEPREIAALSRTAYTIAEAGDITAIRIFEQAGEELAESVAAAIRRLNLRETKVSYQGAVLESCAITRERMTESLKKDFPNIEIVAPKFAPVIGAFLLGCKVIGWAFDENDFQATEKAQIG